MSSTFCAICGFWAVASVRGNANRKADTETVIAETRDVGRLFIFCLVTWLGTFFQDVAKQLSACLSCAEWSGSRFCRGTICFSRCDFARVAARRLELWNHRSEERRGGKECRS